MDRRRPVTAAQWLAARLNSEGEPPTRSRIAAILGVDVSSVYARAAEEGWKPMDFRRRDVVEAYRYAADLATGLRGGISGGAAEQYGVADEGREAELRDGISGEAGGEAMPHAGLDAFMSRQLDRQIAIADRNGGRLDKRQIESLISLYRLMAQIKPPAAERADEKKPTDDELRAMLERIDDRIVELAEGLAEELVRRGDRA